MQTICPNCNTVFRLTDTQLSMAEGIVRCGVCHETFIAQQEDKAPVSARPAKRDQYLDDEPLRVVIPEAFRHQSSALSVLAGLGWSLMILLLALTLALEYAWFHRNELQHEAELKPWLEKICAYATPHCSLEPLREPEKIEMLSRNVYSHPTTKNALMVAVTMINQAAHEQPYPDVQIEFSDVRGGLIAARRFSPDEYLPATAGAAELLPTGSEISFTLELQDPGKEAMTYEFSFL